jgi:ADP-ribose pyrophosphatase YjhB (NUDIX family)
MLHALALLWRLLDDDLRWRIQGWLHATFLVGVSGVVINDRREVLLLKHRFWRITSWALPSGYMNRRETLEAAIIREVREETGLRIAPVRLARLVSGFRYRIETTYLCDVTGGELIPDPREIVAAQFFPHDALPADMHPMHRAWVEAALRED